MAKNNLVCWKCRNSLEDILLPLSRLSKCKTCKADLHVCRLCEFYDVSVSNQCREPIAEKVINKTRANFCGYLQPAPLEVKSESGELKSNEASLESLFGLEEGSSNLSSDVDEKAKNELDALFGQDGEPK